MEFEALFLEKRVKKPYQSLSCISFLVLRGSDLDHYVQPQAVQQKEKIGKEFQRVRS